jgi:hypothetical protein
MYCNTCPTVTRCIAIRNQHDALAFGFDGIEDFDAKFLRELTILQLAVAARERVEAHQALAAVRGDDRGVKPDLEATEFTVMKVEAGFVEPDDFDS